MSTPSTVISTPTAPTLRQMLRWVRETPAPRWEGDARRKARFLGYVGVSSLAWTVVGLAGTALLGQAAEALVSLAA